MSEHVSLAKTMRHQGAGSLVNGVLRSAVRAMDAGTMPDPDVSGVELNMPALSLHRFDDDCLFDCCGSRSWDQAPAEESC